MKRQIHNGEPHDFYVETDRPILNIVEIVLDALFNGGIAAPTVDLSPSRDSGFDFVSKHVLGHTFLELFNEKRSLWPWAYKRHVSH